MLTHEQNRKQDAKMLTKILTNKIQQKVSMSVCVYSQKFSTVSSFYNFSGINSTNCKHHLKCNYSWPLNNMGVNCVGSLKYEFFSIIAYSTTWSMVGWIRGYGGPTVKLYTDFRLCGGSALLTLTLSKSQLHLYFLITYMSDILIMQLQFFFVCFHLENLN